MTQHGGGVGVPYLNEGGPLIVVAAVIVQERRLLVVSKRVAPAIFYLPGGKPDPGEQPLDTLCRELDEELGVRPLEPSVLAEIEAVAAIEGVPMRMTVYKARIDQVPRPAAELADLRWVSGSDERDIELAPAVKEHVLPLLRERGVLGG